MPSSPALVEEEFELFKKYQVSVVVEKAGGGVRVARSLLDSAGVDCGWRAASTGRKLVPARRERGARRRLMTAQRRVRMNRVWRACALTPCPCAGAAPHGGPRHGDPRETVLFSLQDAAHPEPTAGGRAPRFLPGSGLWLFPSSVLARRCVGEWAVPPEVGVLGGGRRRESGTFAALTLP